MSLKEVAEGHKFEDEYLITRNNLIMYLIDERGILYEISALI